ncbi:ABC transporter permease [bacterium]|nr:ABC transporter permease [bacterium]RQV95515.1 MAG: ABC transporter permease [bacterium]
MKVIWALALKDIRILLRDKFGFFFTFFFPLAIAILFGVIFSGDSGSSKIGICVVDEDQTEQSLQFATALDSSNALEVTTCSREEAEDLVRRGTSTAYVVIKKGFGEASQHFFWGDPPTVELGVDPARQAEAGMLQGILTQSAANRFETLFSDPEIMNENLNLARDSITQSTKFNQEEQSRWLQFFNDLDWITTQQQVTASEEDVYQGVEPIRIENVDVVIQREGPANSFSITFPQGIIWGLIGCTAAFSISLVVERTRGTLIRLLMSPVGRMQILGGKALACFLTTFSMSIVILLIAFFIFDVIPASLPMLVIALFSVSLAFVGMMMLLSVLGKTERSAGSLWSVLLIFAMLGGGMIPLFTMPSWMRTISHFSPIKWAILAMEGALWRQFTVREMLLPSGILIGIGIAFFMIGLRMFRWSAE